MMCDELDDTYQLLLRRSSEKWGLDYVHEEAIPITEVLKAEDGARRNQIQLFEFNDKWGFCLCINGRKRGVIYGAFLKFCNPYPTRDEALRAALERVAEIGADDSFLLKWVAGLRADLLQPRLFREAEY